MPEGRLTLPSGRATSPHTASASASIAATVLLAVPLPSTPHTRPPNSVRACAPSASTACSTSDTWSTGTRLSRVRRGIGTQHSGGRLQHALERHRGQRSFEAHLVLEHHAPLAQEQALRHAGGAPALLRPHDPFAAGHARHLVGGPRGAVVAGTAGGGGRCATLEQVAVVGRKARHVLRHVVHAHAKGVVPGKKTDDGGRPPEVHRHLGPEEAVEQVVRAVVERAVRTFRCPARRAGAAWRACPRAAAASAAPPA